VVVEGGNPNYAESASDEKPVLTERQKNIKLRVQLGVLTLVLIGFGPVLQYYYDNIFLYFLAAGIAFTIGTNLTIALLTFRIEDKAELMERRMTNLLEELTTSTEHLAEFNGQLAQFPLESMLETMEEARGELGPTLSQMKGVSWSEISQAVTQGMEFVERLDVEKITGMLQPFLAEAPLVTLIDDPFNEDVVPIDFFPPPPPRHRG
jgi:hypothetical protein